MTDAQQREAARQFVNKWKKRKGREDEEGRSFWIDLLTHIFDMQDVTDRVDFEKKVIVDGHTKRIDVYIPETRVLIEQKGAKWALDKKEHNSGGIDLTPYEQAKRYNDNLPFDEKARWIITCNFSEIWIYNMNAKVPEPDKILLAELPNKYPMLDFLTKKQVKKVSHEMQVSIKAGEIVGKIYDALAKQFGIPDKVPKNETPEQKQQRESDLRSLNALCVRLVFCFYAEDAGIFTRSSFHDYIASFEPDRLREALKNLFKVLDQDDSHRDRFLTKDLAAFPYVNGGLFSDETLEIPPFTEEIKTILLVDASENFDWHDISPTIFGAIFESTLNPETRRKGGMHYTSVENIHKVIDPLFLNDLTKELDDILAIPEDRKRYNALEKYQDKLASLQFLDPAAGSGNFLTESYKCLRQLENKAIDARHHQQVTMYEGELNPIKVSITQFHGIEINDFAVTVAKTALWIAESQTMQETEMLTGRHINFLPLTTNANIVEGNALRMDWNDVVPKEKLDYIMGNPPFVGARLMTKDQKSDVNNIFSKVKKKGNLDFVSCWYFKAAEFIFNTKIITAFVSTNSITQGEQTAILWKPLVENFNVNINFAYRTFIWDSEATEKAHVHCVIIGFSDFDIHKEKFIYISDNAKLSAKHINAYLMDAPDVFIENRKDPINPEAPHARSGNKPIDGGNYLFEKDEMKEFIKTEPKSKKYFRPWVGSYEFINRKPRYCLWLGECSPQELRQMPKCLERINLVRQFRLNSKSAGTRKLADTPTRFHVETIPKSTFLIMPLTSSQRRRYVPIGFITPNYLASNLVVVVENANLYHFGVITSNVFMAWMRAVCGRLKSDYRITKDNVYNNFPWPSPTEKQKAQIEKTAQAILDARDEFPDASLADLYDPLTMPPKLLKAHRQNDKAVMEAYGFDRKMSEADCVAALMKMYQELTEK